ncbi:hypothetical protein GCM10020001_071120 [Nonomuraea salmonea]
MAADNSLPSERPPVKSFLTGGSDFLLRTLWRGSIDAVSPDGVATRPVTRVQWVPGTRHGPALCTGDR